MPTYARNLIRTDRPPEKARPTWAMVTPRTQTKGHIAQKDARCIGPFALARQPRVRPLSEPALVNPLGRIPGDLGFVGYAATKSSD